MFSPPPIYCPNGKGVNFVVIIQLFLQGLNHKWWLAGRGEIVGELALVSTIDHSPIPPDIVSYPTSTPFPCHTTQPMGIVLFCTRSTGLSVPQAVAGPEG